MLISKSIFLYLHSNKVAFCESKFKIIFVYVSLGVGACMFINCLEISSLSDIIEIQESGKLYETKHLEQSEG